MKKLLNKIVSLILVVVSLCVCIGCGEENNSATHPTAMPSYEAYKQTRNLELLAFWSPPPTYQHYEWVKECGFTSIVIDAKYDCYLRTGTTATETLQRAISFCSAVGLDGYITVNRGVNLDGLLTDEFKNEEGFAGIYTDEPTSQAETELVVKNIGVLNSVYKDKKYLTTLTGIEGMTIKEVVDNYLGQAGDSIEWVLFDYYPLTGNGFKSEIAPDWLWVLDTYAKASRETGIDLMSYIATMKISSQTKRKPNEADLRYQSYVSLAYGSKGIAHFCYTSPGLPPFDGEFKSDNVALLNPDYEDLTNYGNYTRTDNWYNAQKVNEEISSFANVYLSYDWVGTMCFNGSDAQTTSYKCFEDNYKDRLQSHDRIKSVSSTEDLIIGCMEDENGYDGFMVVNFSDPFYERSNDVTVDFVDAKKVVAYIGGQKKIITLENGSYTFSLAPGEGLFVIPIA